MTKIKSPGMVVMAICLTNIHNLNFLLGGEAMFQAKMVCSPDTLRKMKGKPRDAVLTNKMQERRL